MYEGITPTKLGRIQSVPALRMDRLHIHGGTPLREVDHAIPVPVLDQEDLFAQDIDTSALVPGAQKADALGSCTCNAGTAHLAERWIAAGRDMLHIKIQGNNVGAIGLNQNAGDDEKFAIILYHLVTDQTGDPASEWPPTDAGSSGYYVCSELERQGLARTYKSASGILGALSLLQSGTVMMGAPFFNAWFEPDSQGFIDGDGSRDAFQAAVDSGVAGGHETLQRGIPQLGQLANGTVDLQKTVIKVRNSWSPSWGPLAGEYLLHASTLDYLSQYCDFKQIVI